jgi:hypothetical protein
MALPDLSLIPAYHPDCCVSLSKRLVALLAAHLPGRPAHVVSVGSGTGLLERLILQEYAGQHDIVGIEIDAQVNKYLPEHQIECVTGTWDCCPSAASASAWLWVYPRTPLLVSRYIQQYGNGNVQKVVWLGPRVDWPEFKDAFSQWDRLDFETPDDCGVVEYEMMVVMNVRKP